MLGGGVALVVLFSDTLRPLFRDVALHDNNPLSLLLMSGCRTASSHLSGLVSRPF